MSKSKQKSGKSKKAKKKTTSSSKTKQKSRKTPAESKNTETKDLPLTSSVSEEFGDGVPDLGDFGLDGDASFEIDGDTSAGVTGDDATAISIGDLSSIDEVEKKIQRHYGFFSGSAADLAVKGRFEELKKMDEDIALTLLSQKIVASYNPDTVTEIPGARYYGVNIPKVDVNVGNITTLAFPAVRAQVPSPRMRRFFRIRVENGDHQSVVVDIGQHREKGIRHMAYTGLENGLVNPFRTQMESMSQKRMRTILDPIWRRFEAAKEEGADAELLDAVFEAVKNNVCQEVSRIYSAFNNGFTKAVSPDGSGVLPFSKPDMTNDRRNGWAYTVSGELVRVVQESVANQIAQTLYDRSASKFVSGRTTAANEVMAQMQ